MFIGLVILLFLGKRNIGWAIIGEDIWLFGDSQANFQTPTFPPYIQFMRQFFMS